MVLNKKIMITENDFLHEIAEIILSLFKDPAIGLTKETVCRDGHFSPKMLTVDRLLHMQCSTMLRLLLYLCTVLSDSEFRGLIKRRPNKWSFLTGTPPTWATAPPHSPPL